MMHSEGSLSTLDDDRRDASEESRRYRICLPTTRLFGGLAFQCGHLEAQDVLAECDDVDLLNLETKPVFFQKVQLLRRMMYRDVSRRLAYVNPGLKRVRLAREYDLLVVMCQSYWELLYVNAIDDWKDHCRTSVCWIDELYAADLPRFRYWLPSLRRFDHVIVGMHGTVPALSEALGRRCHYVPGAVDTLRFAPYPCSPDRVIDVYSVGRRIDAVHQVLLDLVARQQIFYLYDTLQTGASRAFDHRQHRELYGNVAKRSRLFMVAPSKVRYYEGAAAGAVMIGQVGDSQPFREMLGWPDAVVHARSDGSDAKDVVLGLLSEPDRLRGIAQRNVQESLLRHDWIYRWRRILEIAGIPIHPRTESREVTLRRLAARAGLGVSG
jgi:hypothetical protein